MERTAVRFLVRPIIFWRGDNMGPAKLEKAAKLGVKIISEDEFLGMIVE